MLSSTTLLRLSLFNTLFRLVTVAGYKSESFLKCQKYFKKVKDQGKSLPPKDIISSHGVHSEVECSLRCLLASKCLAYNYRPKSTKYAINCQLSTKTQGKESHGSGEWCFYENIKIDYPASYMSTGSKGNKTGSLNITVRSEACDDPGIPPETCGFGNITVNGKDYSPHGRGYNLVIINADTGVVRENRSFDTFEDDNADDQMIEFLNSIAPRQLVLIAIQDEGIIKMSPAGYDALEKVGAQDPLRGSYRSSYALLGWSGPGEPDFVTQVQNERYNGPSIISQVISFPIYKVKKGTIESC